MSCDSPVFRPHRDLTGRIVHGIYDQIPCHWCLGCKADRRNEWQDRIEYERVGRSSAFVTFTYDDYHIPFKDGKPTLCRKHVSDFLDVLHHRVAAHLPSPLCVKNFHYFTVGEYGDKFGRPHYHTIFLGLDFYDCRKLFFDAWQFGIIDSLPILDGGIRYVLKYVDKQVSVSKRKELYDDNGVEPPFSSMSRSLGSGLFYGQYDYIKKTGNYKNLAGKIRPCPQYYKNLFLGKSDPYRVEKSLSEYLKRQSDPIFARYDDYVQATLSAREKYMGDMNLREGRAVLRSPAPEVKGHLRSKLMDQIYHTRLDDFEIFNKAVMEQIYEHNGFTA